MKLPTLDDLTIKDGKALVRADLDMDPDKDSPARLEVLLPTLELLFDRGFSVILLGHRGRPEKSFDETLLMEPVSKNLEKILVNKWGEERVEKFDLHMMENLRFNEGETGNSEDYAKHLAEGKDIYVNDAFASSHREHASITQLPKLMPHFAGKRLVEEVEHLSKTRENPKRPVVVVMGGAKKDKLDYIEPFEGFADKILVGGRLPKYLDDDFEDEKVLVGKLNPDSLDITLNTTELFEEEISKAKTVILAGPMGKFEEEGQMLGTKKVFEAASSLDGYKVAGGGDTQKALEELGLEQKMDWVSVGGGASLEFLAHGTLPGIRALLN